MKRIVALIVVLLSVVAAASYVYFTSLRSSSAGYVQILEAIPGNALLAYSYTNDKEYDEIFRNSTLFTSVTGGATMDGFRAIRRLADEQPGLKQAFGGNPLFFVMQPDSAHRQLDWMVLSTLPKETSWNALLDMLRKRGKLKESGNMLAYEHRALPSALYFMRRKGLIALAFSQDAIRNFGNSEGGASTFVHLSDQQNRNALAGLIINYRMLPRLAGILSRKKNGPFLSMLNGIGGSSATTLSYNKNALLFNGVSRSDARRDAFLPLLNGQKPVRLSVDRILPPGIAAYTAIGLTRYTLFEKKLDSLQATGDFAGRKKQLLDQLSFNLPGVFQQQFGGEFAVALLPNGEKMAFVKIRNGLRLRQYLVSLSDSNDDSAIGRFRYESIPQAFFGPHFSVFRRPYFTVSDDYLIMANQPSLLQDYLQRKKANRLLGADESYLRHKKLMADQGSFSFYTAPAAAKSVLRNELKNEVYRALNDEKAASPANFDGLSLQFSADRGDFYTTICLRMDQIRNYNEEATWTYNIGARMNGEPQVMPNLGGKTVIAVQDVLNRLHLMSDSGKRIEQKALSGRIQGIIHRYNNRMLFVTTNKIYYLNPDGSDLPGFPVNLEYPASADLSVFNNQILVATGNRIRAYDFDGQERSGWAHNLSGTVNFPLQEADFGAKKRVLALTTRGHFYVFSEDGEIRKDGEFPSKSSFPFAYGVRMADDEESSFMLTADKTGHVFRAYLDGRTDSASVGVFSGEMSFECANISGDEKPEMIFLNNRQLTVYSADNTQMYNYLFPVSVKQSVRLITDRGTQKIGVQASSGKNSYLFNDDGTLAAGFPFETNAPFWAGDLYNNGHRFVLVGEGLAVKAYALN